MKKITSYAKLVCHTGIIFLISVVREIEVKTAALSLYEFIMLLQVVIISVLIIILPFADSDGFVFNDRTAKSILFIRILFPSLIVYSMSLLLIKDKKFSVTWIDVFLFLYFIYIVLNRFIVAELTGMTLHFFELTGLFTLYIILRRFTKKHFQVLFVAVMISVVAQTIYGSLQLYGIYTSHHSLFNITGGFFNPGPYAGYLSVGFSTAMGYGMLIKPLYKKPFKSVIRFIAVFSIIAIILVLPATRSRAAWLSVFASTVFLIALKYNLAALFNNYVNTRLKWILSIGIIVILLTGILSMLYVFKKDSADGRLLIWKVTADMFADKPLFGHGYEKHKAYYMDYQSAYFSDHPDKPGSNVADDNKYAFNEALKTAAETGIIGLILAVAVLYFAFSGSGDSKQNHKEWKYLSVAKGGLLTIIVFGMFSYPGDVIPVKIICIAFLAALAQGMRSLFKIVLPTQGRLINLLIKSAAICMLIITIMLYPAFKDYFKALTVWHEAYVLYGFGDYDTSIERYSQAYSFLYDEGDFLVNYGKALSMAGNHKKAISILTQAKERQSNTIVYTSLGDSFKASGKFADSENAYLHAWYMAPAKFYPKYLLAKLYHHTGQRQKAIETANELLVKEIKVPSTAIEEIITEMKNIIENDTQRPEL